MKLTLKKFDITTVRDDSVCVFIAARNSGKTVLVKDLLYYKRDFPLGTVISPTEDSNRAFAAIIPSPLIHDGYTPEIIDKVLKRQRIVIKQAEKEVCSYGKTSIDPRAFLVMDDCMFDNDWKKDKNMRYIFSNGRHRKLLLLMTLQYVIGIPPDLRANIDYVFIMREKNYQNRKKLYDLYCGVFPTYDMFCKVMDVVTEGYGCLVIDNTSRSNKLTDNVFWYEAEMHNNFTIGSKELWDMHNACINNRNDDDDDEEPFDPNKLKPKNKYPPISVRKMF